MSRCASPAASGYAFSFARKSSTRLPLSELVVIAYTEASIAARELELTAELAGRLERIGCDRAVEALKIRATGLGALHAFLLDLMPHEAVLAALRRVNQSENRPRLCPLAGDVPCPSIPTTRA